MKTALLLALAGVASADTLAEHRVAFGFWKAQFGKAYVTAAEEETRFAAFRASLARVAASGNPASGLTKFSDLTPEEFRAQVLTPKGQRANRVPGASWDGSCPACARFPEHANLNASAFDWTSRGAVTGVKDQGQCGSCWSFGTTGDIEGTWFLAGHSLTSLSEQELVSCDKTDDGCGGGLQEQAFAWVIKNRGITTEKNYPYVSGNGRTPRCDETKTSDRAAAISSWFQVSKSAAGEKDIEEQLAKVGPITIGIDATPMQDYSRGIDNPRNCGHSAYDLDHAVLIVGYGTENGVDYWNIKNSWNTNWGEKGYYRIVRGQNKCGVAMDAVHSRV